MGDDPLGDYPLNSSVPAVELWMGDYPLGDYPLNSSVPAVELWMAMALACVEGYGWSEGARMKTEKERSRKGQG